MVSTTELEGQLTSLGKRQAHASGETLWQQGEITHPRRVVSGALLLSVTSRIPGRREVPICVVPPGFVAMPVPGVWCIQHAAVTCRALIPSVVKIEDEGDLQGTDDIDAATAVVDFAGELHAHSLEERLAYLLCLLDTASPTVSLRGVTDRQERARIARDHGIQCAQELLALAAGSRRETVSTILSEWVRQEIISTRYRRILVYDRPRLEQIAQVEG